MAGFCGNCGSPVAPGVKILFKVRCRDARAHLSNQPLRPPTPPVSAGVPISPQPAASQGSNTVVKVILIVVAVIMFLMLLAAGSCFYVAYRVKKKAHEFSQEMGADTTPYTGKRDPCLLSATEVGAILRRTGRGRASHVATWRANTATAAAATGVSTSISPGKAGPWP